MSLVPVVRVKLVKEGNVRTTDKRFTSPEQVAEMARAFSTTPTVKYSPRSI